MVQSHQVHLSLVGAVAWSSTAANTVLSILEAVSFSGPRIPLAPLSVAASSLGVLSLCSIGFSTFQLVRRIHGVKERSAQARKVLLGVSILVSAVALLVSLALIIEIKASWRELTATPSYVLVSDWNSFVSGQVAMWTVSCIGQIALFSSPLWRQKAPIVQPVTVSGPRDSVMSEFRPTRPGNLYLTEPAPNTSALGALPSPTFSTRSSQSLRSFRKSLRHVVRPVTSRTTLVSRPSFSRDARSVYSDRHSIDNVSHSDGFDSWDTSSVSLQARDAVLQTAPSRGTTLEPIPGSRSASPARALDGPFLSGVSEEDGEELARPPRMMPDTSRPPSPAVSEAHIHPLFRTESPTPPPATPGTSIVASPLANQAIACPARPFNRMRSNSRAASPSPLVHSQSFTRDRAMSLPSRSRSVSPPSREMTPPIPDFVLNSSPRSSMSGSRRVNLQHSPDR